MGPGPNTLRALVLRRIMPVALLAGVGLWALSAWVAAEQQAARMQGTMAQRLEFRGAMMALRVEVVSAAVAAAARNSITVGALVGQDVDRVVLPFLRSIGFAGGEARATVIFDYAGRMLAADAPDAWREPPGWPALLAATMGGAPHHLLDGPDIVIVAPIRLGATVEGVLVTRINGHRLFPATAIDGEFTVDLVALPADGRNLTIAPDATGWRGVIELPVHGAPGVGVRVSKSLIAPPIWRDPVQQLLASAFVLVLGCLGGGVMLAASQVVRPVRRLIRDIDAHGLRLEPPGPEAPDEIRLLARRFIDAARDVEDALHRERELSAQQRQFVSMVSHEFRTPLSIIDGAAGAVQRRRARMDDAAVNEKLGVIRAAVTRLIRLMEGTLVAARMDAGGFKLERAPLDLRAMVEALAEERRAITPDAQIALDLDDLPNAVDADERLIFSVVDNLLSNAVKYTRGSPWIGVRGWAADGFACLAVTDYGVGIPEAEIAKIGQRFYRATTSTGFVGTGVGLNMVKMVMDLHGGEMTVASTLGQGSTFTVRLPIGAGADRAGQAAAGEGPLLRVVYASRATAPLSETELGDIVAVARARNARDGLTGCLLHRNGRFAQALEGPPEAVERLLAAISRDARHQDFAVMRREATSRRVFPEWRMALVMGETPGDLADQLLAEIERRLDATLAVDAA